MRIFLMTLSLIIGTVSAEESREDVFYCSDEAIGGLESDGNKWSATAFRPGRFKMGIFVDDKKLKMRVESVDFLCLTPSSFYKASSGIEPASKIAAKSLEKILNCFAHPIGAAIIYDVEEKRYIYSRISSETYVIGDITPAIRVGTCEEF